MNKKRYTEKFYHLLPDEIFLITECFCTNYIHMYVFHNCLIIVEKSKYDGAHCKIGRSTSSWAGQPDLFYSRPLKKTASRVRSGARLEVEHLQITCESLGSILIADKSKIMHCA